MASQPVQPFRLTTEDLLGLDRKTREGLQPLLDALNVTLPQLVAAVQALPQEEMVNITLQTDVFVESSFPLKFRTALQQPRAVVLANIVPRDPDHDLSFPFVMQGFQLIDSGLISIPAITGLLPLNTYDLTFIVR